MDGVLSTNAAELGKGKGGWFIGHFITEDALRKTSDVEVKWGVHARGEKNEGFAANKTAHTMSVLISGRFHMTFRRDGQGSQEVTLANPGDFALWLPGVEHNWEAVEPTVILTVRWPSAPKDQVVKSE